MGTFKEMISESPVGKRGRTSIIDAQAHITPELEKKFDKIVKELGGVTVATVLLNKIKVAPVGTSDSVLKRYKDNNVITAHKMNEVSENKYEELLLKNHIKIKSKFETKYGTEFILAKKYDNNDIKKALKDFKVTFSKDDDNSIFVSK